jgi:hypothetical protein
VELFQAIGRLPNLESLIVRFTRGGNESFKLTRQGIPPVSALKAALSSATYEEFEEEPTSNILHHKASAVRLAYLRQVLVGTTVVSQELPLISRSFNSVSSRWSLLILGLWFLVDKNSPVAAKELEATKEWQLLGENDTVAAGMHIRMDMTTGEKWVKLPDGGDESENGTEESKNSNTNAIAAVVQPDGSVEMKPDNAENRGYDYDMIHRTLSKLPPEEMEHYGGLPELPERKEENKRILTSKERQAFEARMAQIWEQRQAELREVQEMLMDVPEVLKERIRGIREYVKGPLEHLENVDLEKEEEKVPGTVTNIISLLKDLEYQLTDVDNARDFHTMGGWELLVSLLSEDLHVQNKTITKLSRKTEAKIRAVQAYAAWVVGTTVKNTGEFFPYAVERVKIGGSSTTTALDMLLDVFCRDYKDVQSWPIRILLEKSVYGLGSLLRSNRLSQTHLIEVNGATRLSGKLQQLLQVDISFHIKLVQRLLSLASDLITDIQLHGDDSTAALNQALIQDFTTKEWCDSVSSVLVSQVFLPVLVQETVMETVQSMAPYCTSWKGKLSEHKAALKAFQNKWKLRRDDFDPEHWDQLNENAIQAMNVL